jgi:L-serine dehydratase
MTVSTLDIFSIGVGPSSSHTVGPMRAAAQFASTMCSDEMSTLVRRVRVDLFGSLAATGPGHGTHRAILLGLEGRDPRTVQQLRMERVSEASGPSECLRLGGRLPIEFNLDRDVVLRPLTLLPHHTNGMTFTALDAAGDGLKSVTYYSIGGGFVVTADEIVSSSQTSDAALPFRSAAELLATCQAEGGRISDVMLRHELTLRTRTEIGAGIAAAWDAMQQCVRSGLVTGGVLPGGLKVPRRAPGLHARLLNAERIGTRPDPMDWLNVYALAVNEENAAGGRVVTAPTNGAAGIVPAVLHYADKFLGGVDAEAAERFLLVAAAIAVLIKSNASISGAEMGCQGEVGSACAMAAAALCEMLGGTPEQVENAAEMGIEHNLGLTCDPVGGLVQIPCIERNAIAAVKAVSVARLALHGNGQHKVSLDQVIATMRQTGLDMDARYKETSMAGLAVNVVEC